MIPNYKLATYQAHNVLKISDISWNLAGKNLFLVGGRNDQGKTSGLTGILMALCGRSGMDYPEVALKEGETEGWVKIALEKGTPEDNLSVELYLTRRRSGQIVEKFRILDSSGAVIPEPRTLLKRLCGIRAFDPLAFEKLDKRDRKTLLQNVVGLDFADGNKKRARLFNDRARVNREGKVAAAAYDAMPYFPDEPPEEVSYQEILQKQADWANINAENDSFRVALRDHKASQGERAKKMSTLRAQIEELEAEFETQKKEFTAQIPRTKALTETVRMLDYRDMNVVEQELAGAEDTNRKVRANQARAEKGTALTALRSESGKLTAEIEEIIQEQETSLRNATWPVDGLSFDREGVTYNGLPFEQASKSLRVLTSVKIGMALNPKLKLLVCQDGNDLDRESLAALEKILQEEDFQMIVEVVTDSPEADARCAVVIEGGAEKK